MKDLSDRFAQSEDKRSAEARSDPLARLEQGLADEPVEMASSSRQWLERLRGRHDLLTVLCAALAAVFVLWPLLYSSAIQLPAITETSDEIAVLTVRPLIDGGVATSPDWSGLFNAYQIETSLRDISIRCNYGLPPDARIDRYLHVRLAAGAQVRVFLANPERCPKL